MNAGRLLFALCLASSFGGAAVMACSSAATSASPDGDVGTVAAAVTAIGPDGATYSLPVNAALNLSYAAEAGPGNLSLYFDPARATETFSVPSGTYTGSLSGATTLTRVGDAGTTTVAATLTDPQPYSFTVTQGQTTAITFHFKIQNVGNVTFSTGSLTTNLQVDASAVTPGHAQIAGTLSFSDGYVGGPSGLTAALAVSGTVTVPYVASLTLTSPFVPQADFICASMTATVSIAAGDAGAQQNIESFLAESSGGAGQICFYDTSNQYYPGQVQIVWSRGGAAQTPQIIAALGGPDGGVATQSFQTIIEATPSTLIYNGSLASFSTLAQPFTINGATVEGEYFPTNTWVGANGPITLQLLP